MHLAITPTKSRVAESSMKIGIALSGGGFRASLFHLGVLRRIAELGWLARVDAISGVSGGSIIAAFAALRRAEMLGAGGDADAFQKHIAVPFIEVHLSNVHAREPFRRHSYFSDIAAGSIVGLGAQGYVLALQAALDRLDGPSGGN